MHLACLQVTRDGFNPEFVRKLLRTTRGAGIRPRLVLMDREFYSVGVFKAVRDARMQFVTPARLTKAVKRAIEEYVDGRRDAVSRYTVSSGSDKITCNMIILEREDKKKKKFHIAFLTNMTGCTCEDLLELPEEYRKRTGHRDRIPRCQEVQAAHLQPERLDKAHAVLPGACHVEHLDDRKIWEQEKGDQAQGAACPHHQAAHKRTDQKAP